MIDLNVVILVHSPLEIRNSGGLLLVVKNLLELIHIKYLAVLILFIEEYILFNTA